ncbi:MAG: DUF3798 domain-containing protein [Deltaproteobacteria bacterium]|jgi:hypothetical protein|nr:DUF3798 domain-containing protein [Deltaproteobacteria bacterium]
MRKHKDKDKGYRKSLAFMGAAAAVCAAALSLGIFYAVTSATGGTARDRRELNSPVKDAPFQIGVVTVADAQDDDLMRSLEVLGKRFGWASDGGYISHRFFPDGSVRDPHAAATVIEALAEDPDVMAVAVVEGIGGTAEAFRNIRKKRPEVKLLTAETHDDWRSVAAAADIVVNTDFISRGFTIPWAAKKMGAKTLVHVSFPRHMANEAVFRRRVIMEEACQDLGLKFRYENAPDPTADGGASEARAFIEAKMPAWIELHGPDTAFFTTNGALAAPIIKAVVSLGGYFVEADEASPLIGFPEALDLSPKDVKGERGRLMRAIERRVKAKGAEGRLGTWAASALQSHLLALVEMARLTVLGQGDLCDVRFVDSAYDRASPGTDWKASAQTDADGAEVPNAFLVYQDTYVFGRGLLGTHHLEIHPKYRPLGSGTGPTGAAGTAASDGAELADAPGPASPAARPPQGASRAVTASARHSSLIGQAAASDASPPRVPSVLVVTGSRDNTPLERMGAAETVRARNATRSGALAAHLVMPDDVWNFPAAAAAFIENSAQDPNLKVLVLSPSPRGARVALGNLRQSRPELVILASSPSSASPPTAGTAHLTLVPDMRVRAALMPSTSKALGAKSIVHVARDPSNMTDEVARFDRIFRDSSVASGLPYSLAGPEAASDGGKEPGRADVWEPETVVGARLPPDRVAGQGVAAGGREAARAARPSDPGDGTAFFTSDQSLAASLIGASAAGGHSFLGSPLPGPLEGFPEAFGIDLAPFAGQWPLALKRVEDEAAFLGVSGRLVTWSYPFRFTSAAGLTQFALLLADGEAEPGNFLELLCVMELHSPGSGWNGAPYTGPDGETIPGTLAVWQDPYILGTGYIRTSRAELPEAFPSVRRPSPGRLNSLPGEPCLGDTMQTPRMSAPGAPQL